MKAASAPPGKPDGEWTRPQKIAFRFVFCYCALYFIFVWSDYLAGVMAQGTQVVVDDLGALWRLTVPWIGKHILHFSQEITHFPYGPDSAFAYVLVLCFLALAAIATSAWTLLDANRRQYVRLHAQLRIVLRFGLGITLLGYGMGKIFPVQFAFPSLGAIMRPLGDFEPMALLWAFMGYSRPYCIFTGSLEVLGAALLFFRRTTTLGSLIVTAVMANVVMLNLSYDVMIKLFSSHLLLFAIVLLAPDLNRLINVFLLDRATTPVGSPVEYAAQWLWVGKGLFIGLVLFVSVRNSLNGARAHEQYTTKPPLYGIYDVEDLIRDGVAVVPATQDAARWQKAAFAANGPTSSGVSIRFMDDSLLYYRTEYDPAKKLVTVLARIDSRGKDVFAYSQPDAEHIRLDGFLLNRELNVKLRRVDESKLPLLARRFRWVSLW